MFSILRLHYLNTDLILKNKVREDGIRDAREVRDPMSCSVLYQIRFTEHGHGRCMTSLVQTSVDSRISCFKWKFTVRLKVKLCL
jgi:hypothetical protein